MDKARRKRQIEFALAVLLPALSLALLLADHYGVIDHLRGLDRVQAVADNFALSYGPNPSKPVYPSDPAWRPLLSLIRNYSKARLRTDKQPATIARFKASLSTEDRLRDGELSQWTSPSTPFVVLYRYWPNPGSGGFQPDDYTIVGSIGDLQNWIIESKNAWHFLIQDVLMTLFTVALGYSLWRINYVRKYAKNRSV